MIVERGTREPLPAGQSSQVADKLISIGDIRQLFGLGRTAAYDLTHRPGFPAPVRISSRCYRWWETEVAAFAASLRDQAQPGRSRPRLAKPAVRDTSALRITGTVRMGRNRRKAQ